MAKTPEQREQQRLQREHRQKEMDDLWASLLEDTGRDFARAADRFIEHLRARARDGESRRHLAEMALETLRGLVDRKLAPWIAVRMREPEHFAESDVPVRVGRNAYVPAKDLTAEDLRQWRAYIDGRQPKPYRSEG